MAAIVSTDAANVMIRYEAVSSPLKPEVQQIGTDSLVKRIMTILHEYKEPGGCCSARELEDTEALD